MRMNFDSPQIFLDCVGYQQGYKPANCPLLERLSHFLTLQK